MPPARTADPPDVIIVGAGMAGLGAAYEVARAGRRPLVLEASSRAGGVVRTEHEGGFTIDLGPDAILVGKAGFSDLCDELGVGSRLVPGTPPRTAFVLVSGALVALPEGAALGLPVKPLAWLRSRLFSVRGKVRVLGDLVLPRGGGADESIASFVRRRFGAEAVRRLAEPLLAGIHSGDAGRLSMHALFPRLVELERRHRSVILGLRRTVPQPAASEGPFRSFPGGTAEIVSALLDRLPADAIECGVPVHRLEPGERHTLVLADGRTRRAPLVVLAVPAHEASRIVGPVDSELGNLCARIRSVSVATIALGYPRGAVKHSLSGSGYLVPPDERGSRLLAATWSSSKWPHRAPSGFVLLRAFVGGERAPDLLELDDEGLIGLAHDELSRVLGIAGEPVLRRVQRWPRAAAQHDVGHLDLVRTIEARLAAGWPGVFVAGSGFRATGIPDCLADGRATARAALRYLASRESGNQSANRHEGHRSAG